MENLVLTDDLSRGQLVRQSNVLIEAKQSMTAGEKKMLLLLASKIRREDEKFKEYVVDIPSTAKALKIENNNEYRDILSILGRLQSRLVWIPSPTEKKPNRRRRVPWIDSTLDDPDSREVAISFHEELKPFLLLLNTHFSLVPFHVLVEFDGFYEIRIYELLKQYESIRKRSFGLEDLRDKLGVNEEILERGRIKIKRKYTAYKEFRRSVLERARKKLNSKDKNGNYISDISFTYEAIKTGRRVTEIVFYIITRKIEEVKKIEVEAHENIPQVILDIEAFGVKRKTTIPYLKERGEDSLLNTLEYFKSEKEKGKVKTTDQQYLAYLLNINAGQKTPEEIADDKRKKENKKVQKETEEKRNKLKREKDLKEKFEKERDKTARESLVGLPENKLEDLIQQFEESEKFKEAMKSEFTANAYKKYGIEKQWGYVAFLGFIKENFLGEELQTFENWLKFTGVKL